MEKIIRRFYSPTLKSLYSYKGVGFGFDQGVIDQTIAKLGELKQALSLPNDTKIFFGPIQKSKVKNMSKNTQDY